MAGPSLSQQGGAASSQDVVVVVPARMAASRLPGKPLLDLGGLPIVEHVRRRAGAATSVSRVVVATPDQAIADVVRSHGGEVVLTAKARSGSQRVAHAIDALGLSDALVLNVQGDQPLLEPAHLDRVVKLLSERGGVATLCVPYSGDPGDPSVVKVVRRDSGEALLFSRAAVPLNGPWFRHLGIYGFTVPALRWCTTRPEGSLARSEDLEQLRWLEAGASIWVGQVQAAAASVDTEEQLTILRRRFQAGEISSPPVAT